MGDSARRAASREVRERRRSERQGRGQRIPIQALSSSRRRISRAIDRAEERLPPVGVDVIERLRDQDVLLFAAALAFYALVSVVPMLLVGFWLAGRIVGEDRIEDLAGSITAFAPADLGAEELVRSLLAVSAGVGVGALVTALWPATAYGGGLARALDTMSIDRDPALHGLRGRARALAVLAALPLFLLGALVVGYVATGLLADGPVGFIAGWALAIGGGMVATWVGALALYWWFGPAEVAWRPLAEGAGVAAAAITVASLGYLIYVGQGADWEERVAGATVASVILLALWFYLVNLLLLAGYCVALALDDDEHRAPPARETGRGG